MSETRLGGYLFSASYCLMFASSGVEGSASAGVPMSGLMEKGANVGDAIGWVGGMAGGWSRLEWSGGATVVGYLAWHRPDVGLVAALGLHHTSARTCYRQPTLSAACSLLWFKRRLPRYATRFIEMCVVLCADHGPCVSGELLVVYCIYSVARGAAC